MPVSDISTARDELLTFFRTSWNAQVPSVKVIYDDRKQNIPDTAVPWLRVMVRHNFGFQATLSGEFGQRRFQNNGIITIQIFTPFGDGLVLNDQYVQIIKTIFQGNETTPDGIIFRNVRSNEIGEDGPWFNTNILIEFEYSEVK